MSLAQNTALNIGLLDETPRQSCEKRNSAHKRGIGGSEGLPVGSDHIGVYAHACTHTCNVHKQKCIVTHNQYTSTVRFRENTHGHRI